MHCCYCQELRQLIHYQRTQSRSGSDLGLSQIVPNYPIPRLSHYKVIIIYIINSALNIHGNEDH